MNGIKSYYFNNRKLYKIYSTKGKNYWFIVFEEGEKFNLISEGNVYIEIFDFKSGKVYNLIQINNENLYTICIWAKILLLLMEKIIAFI